MINLSHHISFRWHMPWRKEFGAPPYMAVMLVQEATGTSYRAHNAEWIDDIVYRPMAHPVFCGNEDINEFWVPHKKIDAVEED